MANIIAPVVYIRYLQPLLLALVQGVNGAAVGSEQL
jgi:hypothetical protein